MARQDEWLADEELKINKARQHGAIGCEGKSCVRKFVKVVFRFARDLPDFWLGSCCLILTARPERKRAMEHGA